MPTSTYQAIETVNHAFSEASYDTANNFFAELTSPTHNLDLMRADAGTPSAKKPEIANSEGTVQFHLIGQKPEDPAYSNIMNQNQDNLLAMGGLVYGYMKKKYPQIDSKTLDLGTWMNVINHLPCLSVGKQVDKQYSNRIKGVSVSTEFLSLIASAVITEGVSLLSDFNKFLGGIGNIVFTATTEAQKYSVVTATYQSYLVDNQAGGYYDYGAIVMRSIQFKEHFMELKSSCSSAQFVNIDLAYKEVVSLVQTSRIREGGADYHRFQKLVNVNATEDFKRSDNFFNGANTPQKDLKPKV